MANTAPKCTDETDARRKMIMLVRTAVMLTGGTNTAGASPLWWKSSYLGLISKFDSYVDSKGIFGKSQNPTGNIPSLRPMRVSQKVEK